jgi:hypothetical protein
MGCIHSTSDDFKDWMVNKWSDSVFFKKMKSYDKRNWRIFKTKNIICIDRNILKNTVHYYNTYTLVCDRGLYFFTTNPSIAVNKELLYIYWENFYNVMYSVKPSIIYIDATITYPRNNNMEQFYPHKYINIFVNDNNMQKISENITIFSKIAEINRKKQEEYENRMNEAVKIIVPGSRNTNLDMDTIRRAIPSRNSKSLNKKNSGKRDNTSRQSNRIKSNNNFNSNNSSNSINENHHINKIIDDNNDNNNLEMVGKDNKKDENRKVEQAFVSRNHKHNLTESICSVDDEISNFHNNHEPIHLGAPVPQPTYLNHLHNTNKLGSTGNNTTRSHIQTLSPVIDAYTMETVDRDYTVHSVNKTSGNTSPDVNNYVPSPEMEGIIDNNESDENEYSTNTTTPSTSKNEIHDN